MATRFSNHRTALLEGGVLALLTLLCVGIHFPLIQVGLNYAHSDNVAVFLSANEFRVGKWSAFPLSMQYGGVFLTVIRAVFLSIWEGLSGAPKAFVSGQKAFDFVVNPVFFVWASYFLVRAYCSRVAAACVGLLAAIGFQYWIYLCGWDSGFGFLLQGMVLLIWRARLRSPFFDLSHRMVFVAGLISGFLVYTQRSGVLFVFAFFLPGPETWSEFKRLLQPQDRLERGLIFLALVLLGLFFYLEFLGPEVGRLNAKLVKIHATPNLQYAFALFVSVFLKRRWKEVCRPEVLKRLSLLGAGVILGFLPEVVHVFYESHPLARTGGVHAGNSLPGMLRALGEAPGAILELFSAGVVTRNLETQYLLPVSLARNATNLVVLLGLGAVVRAAIRRDRTLEVVYVLAVVALLAHAKVDGPPRYLFPIIPVVLIGIGRCYDAARTRWAFAGLLLVLTIVHGVLQVQAKSAFIRDAMASGREREIFEVVEAFREFKVPVVFSDDYWESLQYAFASQRSPSFTSGDLMVLYPELELALKTDRIGFLLRKGVRTEGIYLGKHWVLSHLKDVRDRSLYVGVHSP